MPLNVRGSNGSPFSFWNMVGGVMVLLKLKDKYDEYHGVSNEDEEGRLALHSPAVASNTEEGRIALLSDTDSQTEIPPQRRTRKKKACCMCCGLDCTLFWKAFGIVLGLFTLYYGFKTIMWVITPAPTGLEGMPIFSTSLGCVDAPYIYNNSQVTFNAAIGTSNHDHLLDIRGGTIGALTIADGAADATEVKYELTIRSSHEDTVKSDIFIDLPEKEDDGTVRKSRTLITAPHPPAGHCVRFDMTMYIPPNLKNIQVGAHVQTHLKFAPGTQLNADHLYVTLYTQDMENVNILIPSKDLRVKTQAFELYSGWIVGEASIVEETEILTQSGGGVANVKFYPTPPTNREKPETVVLRTTSGSGRSDFTFTGSKNYKRPIDATHLSSKNADVYLTYGQSEFSGKVEMHSKSYTVTGARSYDGAREGEDSPWTHYVGDMSGEDRLVINSRGWTGLYF